MSKRRRTSSVQEDEESDEDLSPEQSPAPISARKKKKLDPSEVCQQLYESIRNFKKEDGTTLCDTFIRAPKRRQEPSYYEVVANPIDLLKVQQKLKTDSYEDVDDLTADIELIVKNAKAFYKADSVEYQDAVHLWEVYNTNKKRMQDNNQDPEGTTESRLRKITRPRKSLTTEEEEIEEGSDFDSYEELFAAVMTATDPIDNRELHRMFQLLPSKKLYPDYYDIIDHPIDLKFIANKIQTSAYLTLNEMEKDLLQMTKNACTFNEPGSQIYKDAKALKKIFMTRKSEIESGKYKKAVTAKKGRSVSNLSAVVAALKEEIESSDDDLDDSMETDGDGPLWQLFDQLYNTANTNDPNAVGAPLGESLWKLPNRRFHPEYYNLIKKPISMAQVRTKLKKGAYSNITDMTADLYLMLDNAKKANPPNSKVHKDALKMQKLLNQKLIDSGGDLEESDDEDDTDSSLATPSAGRKKGRPKVPLPMSSPPQSSSIVTSTPLFKNTKVTAVMSLKKKLLSLHEFLVEFTYENRQPMALFMEKPSKKVYPDYYQVIQHPIDMITIENNIKSERYGTLDDIVGDYRLMFSNCRKYNEEGSMIYEDANVLERALNERLKEYSGISKRLTTPKINMKPQRKTNINPLEGKLKQLYDTIREYREPKQNRQLSFIFMKLPSKSEYPDYYDIIKTPIDIEKIEKKLRQQVYESVDGMATDFMLMFENACKYNEPDSQIYKDALCLQQLVIQTKQALRSDDTVPNVQSAIQELLLSLFTSFYNYQDEEGRCYSDSLAELPEYDDSDGNKVRAISLDLIKRRLDKGLYRRLDTFQEDIFSCLERARKLSRTDSQVFEDSIELQSFFIKKRDELCKNGQVLESPAISYNAMHLSAAVESLRQQKLLQEEETETDSETMQPFQGESMTIDQKVFSPGDFVYIEMPENKIPAIMYIERLWTTSDNVKMVTGNMMLRPYETFHVQSRKFMEQEVFKSDQHLQVPLSQAQNKCFVMHVRDYVKTKPEGFPDKDVYVCESRYSSKARAFKKLKIWNMCRANEPVTLLARETPLEVKRVMSVFKERVEKHKEELSELQLQEAIVEKEKPNVVVYVNGAEEGNVYYEQYNTVCGGLVKTGDYVYVATESGKQSVSQITSIWETKDGKSLFRGPWLLTPPEVPGTISRLFYRQEVLLSTTQETTPTIGIVGRCAVLEQHEYITRRPTEIPESDVYMCESIYDEFKRQIRRITGPAGLRKFTHSQMVTTDEIYHFRRPINPPRVTCGEIAAIQENKPIPYSDMDMKDEFGIIDDSIDGPPSIGSDTVATASPLPSHIITMPLTTSKKVAKPGKKLVTGYILYSSEHRKTICASNPEASFGDVSRIVGNEWRNLTDQEKGVWEQRASKINEENAAKYAAEMGESNCPSPAPIKIEGSLVQDISANHVYECCWDRCDYQFEDPLECLEHCISEGSGCVYKTFMKPAEPEFSCIWRNCIRMRRSMPPFPHINRLVKHVREVHLTKSVSKMVMPHDRSKNYVPAKRQTITQSHNVAVAQQSVAVNPTMTNLGPSTMVVAASGQNGMIPINTQPTSQHQMQHQQQQQQQTQQQQSQQQQPSVANVASNQQTATLPASYFNYVPTPPAEPLFVTVPPRPQRVLHSEAYIKYIEGFQRNTTYVTPWQKTLTATRESIPNTDVSRLPTHWLGKRARNQPEVVVDSLWQLRNFMMKDIIQFDRF